MIKLSNRLLKLTEYVSINDKIIDVGCDHSLLGIYLLKNKLVNNIVGCDIVEKALNGAKENAIKYKVNIELRLGDGLKVLSEKDDINTIIISGMGYFKIKKIIEDYKSNINKIDKIIIQTNNKEYDIRKYFTSINYIINKESVIKENSIYYTNIVFIKGKEKYSNLELRLGPYLLKNKDKLFNEYVEAMIKKNISLLNIIPKNYILLRIKKRIELNILKKEIK